MGERLGTRWRPSVPGCAGCALVVWCAGTIPRGDTAALGYRSRPQAQALNALPFGLKVGEAVHVESRIYRTFAGIRCSVPKESWANRSQRFFDVALDSLKRYSGIVLWAGFIWYFGVDGVDARDKSHRTNQRGDKGPAGMDRGPRGPHESCATFRTQRVDMQSMWRQGSWCRMRTLVSPHEDSSRWSAHHARSS